MNQVWLYSIGSVVIVSLISLIGALSLLFKKELFQKIVFILVAFAAGSLLGDAFIHLLPEIIENGDISIKISLYILAGIVIFFVLEKFIHWRHCHMEKCIEHPAPLGTLNILGDILHNFIDGAIIAGSFLVSIPLGISTTIAVIFHEVPHEMGNFAILVHSGYSRKKALLFNFLSATTAIIGAIFVLAIGKENINGMITFIIPFTMGGFVYVALSDLVPELHKEVAPIKSLLQLCFFILGIVLMALLLVFE
jgi:zinc and cadmium transporter